MAEGPDQAGADTEDPFGLHLLGLPSAAAPDLAPAEDDPDPLREFQFECQAAGGLNTRGVMVSEDGTKVKHFSLCLPASLGSEGLQ